MRRILVLVAALQLMWSPAAQPASLHHVPNGFTIERVASSPEVEFPMFATFDDHGRLFVAESSGLDLYAELTAQTRKCRIRVLEDRDGDGRFESATIFADKLVFPMGLVWRKGRLYVADPPDVVVFEDRDDDGRADDRKVVLTGFGHKDNGSLHGLVFGPDDRLYMTMGSPDGYRLRRSDGRVLTGESGALIRCRADGSDPEVLCRGFENLVEVAFTPSGIPIGTDNWFQLPSSGARDALVHLIEGGLYPYHREVGTPLPITGPPLPPISLYPAVALSGLALYRGGAFPEPLRGNLFSAQHNSRKIGRHVLLPQGASFRVEDSDFVTSDDPDFHPSDVLESADGSLIVVDTGSWYVQHCPTGKIRNSRAPGGIFRVRRNRAAPIADPWGKQIYWERLSLAEVIQILDDHRPNIRDDAQRVLAGRGEKAIGPVSSFLDSVATIQAKQHALWALAAIPTQTSLAPLRRMLHSRETELQATAARALALRNDRAASLQLAGLLDASPPPVALAAAEALAHCGETNALPAIWRALSAATIDRFLEHALIHAVHLIADNRAVEAALASTHPRAQKAALILLDQPPRKALRARAVLERASSPDLDLRQAALVILQKHPEWADDAANLLGDLLGKADAASIAELRELILAFQKQPILQQRIAQLVTDRTRNGNDGFAERLLEIVMQTTLRPLPAIWIDAVSKLLGHESSKLRIQAVRTAGTWQSPQFAEPLLRIADDSEIAADLRLEALRAIAARRPKLSQSAYKFLLMNLNETAEPITRLSASRILSQAQLSDSEIRDLLPALKANTLITPGNLLATLLRCSDQMMPIVFEHLAGLIRAGWRPSDEHWKQIRDRLPSSFEKEVKVLTDFLEGERNGERRRLAEFEPLLRDGDPARGRSIFFGSKVACSTCHRFGSDGGIIGPDLTKVGAIRSGRDLIESIVFPSSTFAQGYESYSIRLRDGSHLDGTLARQDVEAIVIRDASGAERFLTRREVQEMNRRPTSLMPEGLEGAVTKEEFRDLLAFLQSLK